MHNYNKRRINHKNDEKTGLSIIKTILLLCIAFFLFSIIFATLLSLFFFKTENPTSKIRIVAIISIYFSSFMCGIILARIISERIFIYSTILGTMIFLITFVISLFIRNNQYSIFWHMILPVIAVLGSQCGKRRPKNKKHRHKAY